MRKATTMALMGFLATLVLSTTAAFAVSVDVHVDKRIVPAGGTMTVSGTVTNDDGTPGVFDYRIAVVAPSRNDGGDRIIVCDSGKLNTNGSSNVSYTCSIPTIDGLQNLGVQNAADRAVIPLKGGIAVLDSSTNKTVKIHGEALIVNTDRIKSQLQTALDRIDTFINKSQLLASRCDNITAKAEQAGAQNVVEKCSDFQSKVQDKIDAAAQAKDRINTALANLDNATSLNFTDLGKRLFGFGLKADEFKIDTSQFRTFFDTAKADLEKKVTADIVNKTRERAMQLEEQLKEQRNQINEKLKEIQQRVEDRKEGRLLPTATSTTTMNSSGSESNSSTQTGTDNGTSSKGGTGGSSGNMTANSTGGGN